MDKTVLSVICERCEDEKVFTEKESVEILKILDLIKNMQESQMKEENISQGFRLKILDQTGNFFIEEINQNESMSKKHVKICKV